MTVPIGTGAAEVSPPPSAASPRSDTAELPPLPAPSAQEPESEPVRPPAQWVVLTAAGSAPVDDRPVQMRKVAVSIGLAAIVIACIVGFAGSLVSRQIAEKQSVHDAAQLTDLIADTLVQPALTDRMATSSAEAARVLGPIVHNGVLSGDLVRVKLWNPSGTILYSDEPKLIGQRFVLSADARAVFANPHTQAEISDTQRPENSFEHPRGKLLEVYRPVWTPNGEPLLFETYFTYDSVRAHSQDLWRGFGGIMLSSLFALLVLLLPLVWLLMVNARRARAQREELMRRALDASDEERHRIAASLHDGVVQQLAAASFTAAGQAEQAAVAGDSERAAGLDAVATTVRDSIAGLRSLLVDIYPASLHSSGLAVALRDLARTTSATEAVVAADIDDAVTDALPVEVQEAVFRVAQEALRNAIRHSGATHYRLTLAAVDDQWAELEIADDGRGFDTMDGVNVSPEGHFGLRLMTDAAARCGARLEVRSAPGQGTQIRMTVPRT